jgi:colanic acid biosynthesis glycosyl transferase WcaI
MHLIWRPHVVLVVAPTLFSAPAAWIMARLNGAITWLHVQDFELDVAMNLGMVQGDLAQGIASAVEHFWFRRFDRVSTISNKMIERLHEKGVPAKKIVSLPNWVDTEAIYPLMRPSIFRQTLGLNESDFVALYAGNMGEKQGLEIIVEAARKLERRSDVVLVLAGAGAAKARLESQVKGLTNVRWLPLQPTERLNDLLNLANVHLLPQRSGAADLVMPSKLTGMLASGRPIIATAERGTQIAEVVTLCGCVVPPGSADPLVKALLDLCRNREKRIALGKRARAYACERLAKPVILSKAADQLAAAVSEKQKT